MPNIVNAVLLRQGNVLLARRSPHREAYPGLWSFPGGHVEAGETLEQALIREVCEEVNVAPVTYRAIARIADPNNTASEPITYHIYVVKEWSGQPVIADDEHTELRWFTLKEAQALPSLALEDYRSLFVSLMRQFQDLKIVIENPKGTSKAFRRKSSGDPAWRNYPLYGMTYPVDYGYIEGFQGEDKMDLDVFLGSGELFGYFRMWKVDVPSETKFFARVTQGELQQILAAFGPVLLDSETLSEDQFMVDIERFRI